MNIDKTMQTFADMTAIFKECKGAKAYLEGELQIVDNELMDIRHIIELEPPMSRTEAAQTYRRQRTLLQKRRSIKDELEIVDPLSRWCEDYKAMPGYISNIVGPIRAILERQANRAYMYRSQEKVIPHQQNEEGNPK